LRTEGERVRLVAPHYRRTEQEGMARRAVHALARRRGNHNRAATDGSATGSDGAAVTPRPAR